METDNDTITNEGQVKAYGPFHRLRSTTQTDDVAQQQEASQELWGRPRQFSDIPQVQAYTGPLSAEGVEFYTTTAADSGTAPGHARWTGPRPGVRIEDGYAKIKIQVTKNTQRVQQFPTETIKAEDDDEELLVA